VVYGWQSLRIKYLWFFFWFGDFLTGKGQKKNKLGGPKDEMKKVEAERGVWKEKVER